MINSCKRCEKQFIPKISSQKFCSNICLKKFKLDGKIIKRKYERTGEWVTPPSNKKLVYVGGRPKVERKPKKSVVERAYLKKYGVTVEEFESISLKQDNRCAICGGIASKLLVDHCHTRETVRGLLCVACNSGLGLFRDSITALQSAIKYLEEAKNITETIADRKLKLVSLR